jgi:hypothetical protein
MSSSGMLCHVALVTTNVSEEHIASIKRVTRISELGMFFLCSVFWLLVTANVVPSLQIHHPRDGGNTFLRNMSFYKSHMA